MDRVVSASFFLQCPCLTPTTLAILCCRPAPLFPHFSKDLPTHHRAYGDCAQLHPIRSDEPTKNQSVSCSQLLITPKENTRIL